MSVRLSVVVPAWLGAKRVFQKTSLPLKNARFMPASRAASTFARWLADQYSSCPLVSRILWFCRTDGLLATSTPLT